MTQIPHERRSDRPVLIDTSLWIEYFRGKNQLVIREIELLIDQRKARTLPIILAELLRGCLTSKETKIIQATIGEIPTFEFPGHFWAEVGLFCFGLARKGFSCGLIDGYIAKAAIDSECFLFTQDKDFIRISRLSSLLLWKTHA
jgi:predicted nucleic acid-binding protein